MELTIWYWICLFGLAVICGVFDFLEKRYMLYDIHINGDFIRGCRCKFHPFRHEINVINPNTGREIVVVYQHYCIERMYWKWRRKENETD